MLTESFIASTLNSEKSSNGVVAGIHLHDFQPISALKASFKKSSTNVNCLAVSPSHIFAAQADKAVVHLYSRERNHQEAIVPFPERIYSIALAGATDGAGILILGTEGGRVILWELGTGRQVSTPQHHLQVTTCLAVDPTSNFLLSGSRDSTVNVWSIPGLLSFSASSRSHHGQEVPFSPLRSLSNHRAAVTAILFGHSFSSNNIAVSASRDNTCIVWNYVNGDALHTFLLPSSPLCLALDPADRAIYAGYEDGSIQLMNFYNSAELTQTLHDPTLHSAPTQPPTSARWSLPDGPKAASLCVQVNYDGTSVLSGSQDGKINTWDVGIGEFGRTLADFAAPITNLIMLTPTGFPSPSKPKVKLHNIVKPRYDSFTNGTSTDSSTLIPANYTFTAHFTSTLPLPGALSDYSFHEALSHTSFPSSLLEEALEEFTNPKSQTANPEVSSELADLRAQNAALASRLEMAVGYQQQREKEDWRRQKDQEIKAARKKKRRLRRAKIDEVRRKKEMGETIEEDIIDGEEGQEEDLSSSTDEMTQSD